MANRSRRAHVSRAALLLPLVLALAASISTGPPGEAQLRPPAAGSIQRPLIPGPPRVGTAWAETFLTAPNGNRLYAHLHYPTQDSVRQFFPARERLPALALCPAGRGPGVVFDGPGPGLSADQLAQLGFVVLHFDPEGRGRSEGLEDDGGPAHQGDLLAALQYLRSLPQVDPDNIGVVSTSFGVTMAAGCLARHPELGAKYLLDQEGPSNRRLAFHPLRREHPDPGDPYWDGREADAYVGQLRCRYLRVQAQVDHAQREDLTLAFDMVNAALAGGCPWVCLNGNVITDPLARDHPERYPWLPGTLRDNPLAPISFLLWLAEGPPVGRGVMHPFSGDADAQASPFGFHPASVSAGPRLGRYDFAREIGIGWHRNTVYAFPFLARGQPQGWDPAGLDAVAGFPSLGINVMWTLSARGLERENSFLPVDLEAYQAHVRAVVERYDGDAREDAPGSPRVPVWQVENEPNLFREGSPESYARLLEVTYAAVKEADATAKVILGGYAANPDRPLPQDFLEFYGKVLDALTQRAFDIFDYHWFGFANGDYRKQEAAYRTVRATLDAHGLADAPIWVCETGTYAGAPRGRPGRPALPAQSEEQQAEDLLKRYVFPLSLGVQKVFWAFGMVEGFGPPDADFFDFTGLVSLGASEDAAAPRRKLAFYTYKLMVSKLAGADFSNIRTLDTQVPHLYAYELRRPQGPVWVAWWDYFIAGEGQEPPSLTLAVPAGASAVVVTEAVPGRDGRWNRQEIPVRDRKIGLVMRKSPVFVELEY